MCGKAFALNRQPVRIPLRQHLSVFDNIEVISTQHLRQPRLSRLFAPLWTQLLHFCLVRYVHYLRVNTCHMPYIGGCTYQSIIVNHIYQYSRRLSRVIYLIEFILVFLHSFFARISLHKKELDFPAFRATTVSSRCWDNGNRV